MGRVVLTSNANFDDKEAFEELKDIIKADMRVLCIPFASDLGWLIKCRESLEYGEERKKLYKPFKAFGIEEGNFIVVPTVDDVEFLKYKIKTSGIIYFTGGKMENIRNRLQEGGLWDFIKDNCEDKILIGASAGALILQDFYQVAPYFDDYYDYYKREVGLGIITKYNIIPHFHLDNKHHNEVNNYMIRILRNKKVIALGEDGGIIVSRKSGCIDRHFGKVYWNTIIKID